MKNYPMIAQQKSAQEAGEAAYASMFSALSKTCIAKGAPRPATASFLAGLSESAVRDILRRRSNNPGLVTLARIASVYGVSLGGLLGLPDHTCAREELSTAGRHVAVLTLLPVTYDLTLSAQDAAAVREAEAWLIERLAAKSKGRVA
ncbi:MAG: hypothetical protein AAGM38_15900 [Pseudomonadota bacterium]